MAVVPVLDRDQSRGRGATSMLGAGCRSEQAPAQRFAAVPERRSMGAVGLEAPAGVPDPRRDGATCPVPPKPRSEPRQREKRR